MLWSGSADAKELAAALGTSLEKTAIGGFLNKLQSMGIGSRVVWDEASRIFVSNASGKVTAVLGQPMYAGSTFARVEIPAAAANKLITTISIWRLH